MDLLGGFVSSTSLPVDLVLRALGLTTKWQMADEPGADGRWTWRCPTCGATAITDGSMPKPCRHSDA